MSESHDKRGSLAISYQQLLPTTETYIHIINTEIMPRYFLSFRHNVCIGEGI